MQSVIDTIKWLDFDTSCTAHMVQQIRSCITNAGDPVKKARDIVRAITSIDVALPDIETAIPFTQYVAVIGAEEVNELTDHQPIIDKAFERVAILFKTHPWAASQEQGSSSNSAVTFIEGIDTKVEVNSNGKLKKGGKQILAIELYKKHVLESLTPVDSKKFVEILMTELGMTKAGATTYRYNVVKQFAS